MVIRNIWVRIGTVYLASLKRRSGRLLSGGKRYQIPMHFSDPAFYSSRKEPLFPFRCIVQIPTARLD